MTIESYIRLQEQSAVRLTKSQRTNLHNNLTAAYIKLKEGANENDVAMMTGLAWKHLRAIQGIIENEEER